MFFCDQTGPDDADSQHNKLLSLITATLSCMIGARNRGYFSTARPKSHVLLSNQERRAMRFSRVLRGAPVQHAPADLQLLQSASLRDIGVATSSPESPHCHRQLEA